MRLNLVVLIGIIRREMNSTRQLERRAPVNASDDAAPLSERPIGWSVYLQLTQKFYAPTIFGKIHLQHRQQMRTRIISTNELQGISFGPTFACESLKERERYELGCKKTRVIPDHIGGRLICHLPSIAS